MNKSHCLDIKEIEIIPIPALKDNYIWALIAPNRQTIIIDPGEYLPVTDFLKQRALNLTAILITHHHWDHTNGVVPLQEKFKIPIYGTYKEQVEGVTIFVKENSSILINGFPITFHVLDIPGHTLGHVAYYTQGIVFCGDTLFSAGCGRIFEGTAEQLYASLLKIASLPDETKIYCAHEYTLQNLYFASLVEPNNIDIAARIKEVTIMRKKNLPSLPSTLRLEKKINPFLRCQSPALIAQVEHYAGKPLATSLEIFTNLRQWKNEINNQKPQLK